MKRIFFFTTFSLSISIELDIFLCLSFFLLFPAKFLSKLLINMLLLFIKLNFSDLDNSGNILNQNFKFYNLHIKHNDKTVS